MININFFEKKETNILPYLVAGSFFLLLVLMSIYFFFRRMYLTNSIADKEIWTDTYADELLLSKEIGQLDQKYEETLVVKDQLKADQYPMFKLANEIADSVPDELTRISSFQLLEGNQLTLTLENTEAEMAQEIVENIESLPYIRDLQLLYAESQGEEDGQLRFELIISLDEDLLVEEETE